ncbi:hypothetical protein [Methylophaga sp.]|uniref:hypothetical protein n=1 Tax=Methylophaga sp. TaxID=2024840 RepID=UPI002719519C|nr:hypothetical protein [Methylophaga sp.]MDO8827205.1 hypothetical protein [Methylophaga sp.]
MMKYGIGLFVALCLLVIGYCIGATEHKNIFSGVKWTDIGTLLVTFFGFAFGFFTYFQWLSSKRKEDAYLAAKKYVASIDEIEEHLHELLFQYNHICPVPGLLVESKDISAKRIEHLNNVWSHLYQARRSLYKSHRELEFWNVKLTDVFSEDYEAVNKSLDNISVESSVLNNQLFHFIENNMENMDSVIRHKKHFDEFYTSIHKVTQKRVQCGFKAIFRFDQ